MDYGTLKLLQMRTSIDLNLWWKDGPYRPLQIFCYFNLIELRSVFISTIDHHIRQYPDAICNKRTLYVLTTKWARDHCDSTPGIQLDLLFSNLWCWNLNSEMPTYLTCTVSFLQTQINEKNLCQWWSDRLPTRVAGARLPVGATNQHPSPHCTVLVR